MDPGLNQESWVLTGDPIRLPWVLPPDLICLGPRVDLMLMSQSSRPDSFGCSAMIQFSFVMRQHLSLIGPALGSDSLKS